MPTTSPAPSHGRLVTGLLALALTVAALLVPALTPPAQATIMIVWTGNGATDHWGDPQNWNTGTVPGPADTVVVQEISGHTVRIDALGAVTVANLILAGGENNTTIGSDGTGSLTVTQSMAWSGGEVGVPLTIASGATLHITTGHDKYFTPTAGQLSVAGNAVITNTGISDGDGVQFWWDSGLRILPGGTLTAHGQAQVSGNRCCGADFPSAVDNGGTLSVPDGKFTIERMGLYQHGHIHVADGALLADDHGIARLGAGSYDGSGRLYLSATDGPAPQPDHLDRNQGGALLTDIGTLADGFEIVAGDDTELTGVGTLTGAGTLTLADATVYAQLHLAGAVRLEVPSHAHSWLWTYSDLPGYHAALTLSAGGAIEPGGHLTVHPGSRLAVSGGRLDVGMTATLDSDSCCSTAPQVVVGARGALAFHGNGPDQTALMKWLTVSSAGQISAPLWTTWTRDTLTQTGGTTTVGSVLDAHDSGYTLRGGRLIGAGTYRGDVNVAAGSVQPTGTLRIDGDYTQGNSGTLRVKVGATHTALAVTGTARLHGTLVASVTSTPHRGTRQRVLSAGTRSGSFGCVLSGSWTPTYGSTSVSLTRIGVAGSGCFHAAASTRLSTTLRPRRARWLSTVFGAHARQVLVAVRLTHASRKTKVALAARGGGRVSVYARPGSSVTRYLVVRVGSSHRMRVLSSSGRVRVRVRELGWYR